MVRMYGDSTQGIRTALAVARETTSQLIGLWKAKEISLKLRKPRAKSLVWSVALFGSEIWTLNQSDMARIAVCEMGVWRRVSQISWKEKKTAKSWNDPERRRKTGWIDNKNSWTEEGVGREKA